MHGGQTREKSGQDHATARYSNGNFMGNIISLKQSVNFCHSDPSAVATTSYANIEMFTAPVAFWIYNTTTCIILHGVPASDSGQFRQINTDSLKEIFKVSNIKKSTSQGGYFALNRYLMNK